MIRAVIVPMVIGHLLVAQVHVLMIVEQDTIAQEVVDRIVLKEHGRVILLYQALVNVLHVLKESSIQALLNQAIHVVIVLLLALGLMLVQLTVLNVQQHCV